MAASDQETKKEEKFLNRAERKKCWTSRDDYWACLDKCVGKSEPDIDAQCGALRKLYTADCPASWVTHFDRKYRYEKFKVLLKKEGFQEKADEEFMNKDQKAQ